jgi:hypothetical protein
MKINKPQMNIRVMSEKTTTSIVPNIRTTIVVTNNHMVVIQV